MPIRTIYPGRPAGGRGHCGGPTPLALTRSPPVLPSRHLASTVGPGSPGRVSPTPARLSATRIRSPGPCGLPECRVRAPPPPARNKDPGSPRSAGSEPVSGMKQGPRGPVEGGPALVGARGGIVVAPSRRLALLLAPSSPSPLLPSSPLPLVPSFPLLLPSSLFPSSLFPASPPRPRPSFWPPPPHLPPVPLPRGLPLALLVSAPRGRPLPFLTPSVSTLLAPCPSAHPRPYSRAGARLVRSGGPGPRARSKRSA